MAQSYFSPTNASKLLPNLSKAPTAPATVTVDKVTSAEDVESAYIEQKDRYVHGC